MTYQNQKKRENSPPPRRTPLKIATAGLIFLLSINTWSAGEPALFLVGIVSSIVIIARDDS